MHLWNLDLHEADQFIQIIDNWNKTFSTEDSGAISFDGAIRRLWLPYEGLAKVLYDQVFFR